MHGLKGLWIIEISVNQKVSQYTNIAKNDFTWDLNNDKNISIE